MTEVACNLQEEKHCKMHDMRCKRCHKLLLRYVPEDVPRTIEIVCTKCKYKNVVII